MLTHNFFLKCLILWGCLSVPHLVDLYAKNVDGRRWNFMCERTLPSLLVIV